MPEDIMRVGFSLFWAKSVLTEFKRICRKEEFLLDLQLYYAECGTDSVYYGVTVAIANCPTNQLYQRFGERLKCLLRNSDGSGMIRERRIVLFKRKKMAGII